MANGTEKTTLFVPNRAGGFRKTQVDTGSSRAQRLLSQGARTSAPEGFEETPVGARGIQQNFDKIRSEDLNETRDFQTVQPGIETQGAALAGAIDTAQQAFEADRDALAQQDQFTQDLDDTQERRRKSFEDSLRSFFGSSVEQRGETELQDELFSRKGGVDEIQVELDEINSQIRQEQHSLRREIERLEKNPRGLFGGALADEMERVERDSIRKQADLSVVQMGIQQRFNSAKAIADRAVQVQLERQKIELDTAEKMLDINRDLFTTAEARQFESALADRNRQLDREEKELQQISDLSIDALQNGAPTSVVSQMRAAKTPEDAIAIGGNYVGRLDRVAKQLANEKRELEIDALKNPPDTTDADTLKAIGSLSDSSREKLVDADDTIRQLNRLVEIVKENDDIKALSPTSEIGREFSRLAEDVADKMARERTGAVVSSDEQRSFKKILGVGFTNVLISDDAEIEKTLTSFINKHERSAALIDPTGDIRAYLNDVAPLEVSTADDYVDSVVTPAVEGASALYGRYLNPSQ